MSMHPLKQVYELAVALAVRANEIYQANPTEKNWQAYKRAVALETLAHRAYVEKINEITLEEMKRNIRR